MNNNSKGSSIEEEELAQKPQNPPEGMVTSGLDVFDRLLGTCATNEPQIDPAPARPVLGDKTSSKLPSASAKLPAYSERDQAFGAPLSPIRERMAEKDGDRLRSLGARIGLTVETPRGLGLVWGVTHRGVSVVLDCGLLRDFDLDEIECSDRA